VLFDTPGEAAWLASKGMFPRVQYQFWWRNEGYTSHEEFLTRFPSKERNKLRRERKECANLRIDAFMGPDHAVMDILHAFYADTTARHMWGHAYLTREFFRKLADTWGHRLQVTLAKDGDTVVAGAMNVVKGDRLYGRYWGTKDTRPFLHFEICYHQGIDWCIRHGLAVFEPGHGGEHKYKRGFLPEITWSSHALAHPGLHRGLMEWSAKEGAAVRAEVERLRAESPMRPAASKAAP
jgi:predicted N-acyltransferase